ncbi:MAG: hypothetical protein ACYTFG_22105, partial [Planctomycetota bacterium]
MFGNRRGISQTPFLIVTVILFLGACGMAWMHSQTKTEVEGKLARAQTELKSTEDQFREKVDQLDRICDATGYFTKSDEGESLDRTETVILQHIDMTNKKLSPPLTKLHVNCKNMIDELARQLSVRDDRLREQELNLETKDNRITETEETKTRLVKEKQERIDALTEDAQRNQQRLEQNIQAYERQVTDLRERIKNLSAENERVSEEKRAEAQKLTAEIKTLQARVIALSKREQIESTPMPDGRITRADIDQGYAYMDLGTKDGVRAGQRFKVYSVL